MKALRIQRPGEARSDSIEIPVMNSGDVLLRVEYVGFCGSDLSTYQGRNPLVTYPRVPGHEIGAVVEAAGSDVPETVEIGSAVTVMPYTSCGVCSSCGSGRFNACRYNRTLGVQTDGAMAEYISVHWTKLVPGAGRSTRELSLVEPLTIGFHAADRARVTDSDTVLVLGCGMIGIGAVVRSALRGARVIAADIAPEKLTLARLFGARETLLSTDEEFFGKLGELTCGDGPDVVIEAAGNPVTYRTAVEAAAFAGRIVCIGYAKEDVPLPTRLFVQKELDVLGSRNATRKDFEAALRCIGDSLVAGVPIDRIVTRTVGFEAAPGALAGWAADPGAVLKLHLNTGGPA